MADAPVSLMTVYRGWDGYQRSLVSAIAPRSREELLYRPTLNRRSTGEVAAHIALGRIDWFNRMSAPGSRDLADMAGTLFKADGGIVESMTEDAVSIVEWLKRSWEMVENMLTTWTVDDLAKTYSLAYKGNVYSISHQWTIWRIMAHDIHHGGQLSLLLGMQGIELPDLGDNGGHIIEPPIVGCE